MGRPSFKIGAVGARKLLLWESSVSLDSTGSLRFRIFLIETLHFWSITDCNSWKKATAHTNLLVTQRAPRCHVSQCAVVGKLASCSQWLCWYRLDWGTTGHSSESLVMAVSRVGLSVEKFNRVCRLRKLQELRFGKSRCHIVQKPPH